MRGVCQGAGHRTGGRDRYQPEQGVLPGQRVSLSHQVRVKEHEDFIMARTIINFIQSASIS